MKQGDFLEVTSKPEEFDSLHSFPKGTIIKVIRIDEDGDVGAHDKSGFTQYIHPEHTMLTDKTFDDV